MIKKPQFFIIAPQKALQFLFFTIYTVRLIVPGGYVVIESRSKNCQVIYTV